MVSLDDFERLARYQANELTGDEARALEAELATNVELKQALRQLQLLDGVAGELQVATLQADAVEALVTRAMKRKAPRAWLVAAGLVLLAGSAWLLRADQAPRFDLVLADVTIDGRRAQVGDSVGEGALIVSGEQALASIDRGLLIAPSSEVRVSSAVVELFSGAVVARGEDVRVMIEHRTFIVNGEAILSREPFETTFRETAHLTPERLVNMKRMTLGGVALISGAAALYVLTGTVRIVESGAGELVHAPNRWFANGVTTAQAITREGLDGGAQTAQLQTFDGLLEVRVLGRGQPVPGAKVKLYERGPYAAARGELEWREGSLVGETNDAGVVLLGANSGAYVVAVRARGWPTTLREVQRPTGESMTSTTITLEPGATLSGVTVDGRTRQPVVPAAITVRPWLKPEAESVSVDVDARGAFAIESLSEGMYALEGVAPGVGKTTEVVRVPLSEPVKLVFRGSGFVEGFVKLEDGGVAAGAKVVLVGEETLEGEASASGSFSIEAPSGVWRAQAYLGALVGAAPDEVRVHPAETSPAVIIVLQGAAVLSGRVLKGDAGVERATVSVSPHKGSGELGRAETNQRGEYRVPLPPGVYDVEAVAIDDARITESGVHVGQRETKLDLQIPASGMIRGTVVDREGNPLEVSVEGYPRFRKALRRTTLSVGGAFEIKNVPPGFFTVATRRKNMTVGIEKVINVVAGEVHTVAIVMGEAAIIEGRVSSKCGAAQPLTLFVMRTGDVAGAGPVGESTEPMSGGRQTLPAGESKFRLEVLPGRYRVIAHNEDDSCAGEAPATVDAKRPAAVTLEVVPNRVTFEVNVKEADGHPAKNALVAIATEQTGPMAVMVEADEDGVLQLRGFGQPDNRRITRVSASKDGRAGESGPIAPGTKTVTVTLGQSQRLVVNIEGGVEGSRSTLEVVAVPDFVFADALITTSSQLTLEAVPAGRLHVTVKNGERVGEGELQIKPGESATLTVRLVEGGVVKGRLVAPGGRPASGWVGLLTIEGEENRESLAVDNSGLFELSQVTPGEYLLNVAGQKATTPVTVKAGEVVNVGDIVAAHDH